MMQVVFYFDFLDFIGFVTINFLRLLKNMWLILVFLIMTHAENFERSTQNFIF